MTSEDIKIKSCVQYFKERRDYDRVFTQLRKKWKSYGKASGGIEIKKPSDGERETLGDFLCKDFYKKTVRFMFSDFEKALGKTKFQGVALKELLSGYFGEDILTNREETEIRKREITDFISNLKETDGTAHGVQSGSYKWLENVTDRRFGYQLIYQEFKKSPEGAKALAENVCSALAWLSRNKNVRLAVLGAVVTKDPHTFDSNTVQGKLLIHALSCLNGGEEAVNAEETLMLYYTSGIIPDDISSFTVAYGVQLYTEDGPHPAYEGFIKLNEPYMVTLKNLTSITKADVENKKVYLVENQMVFSHICDKLGQSKAAVICTSGRMKTASWMLLDLLSKSGCEFYYSGDFDPEGLGIAEKLLLRYPENSKLWCMELEDYLFSVSDKDISEKRMVALKKINHPSFNAVKMEMCRLKKAGYQEQLIDKLIEEIEKI